MRRYALSAAGPVGVSAVHFIATLALIRLLSPAEFGLFAFLFLLVNMGTSLSNALVSTPYSVIVNDSDPDRSELESLFGVSVLLSLAVGGVAALFSWMFGGSEAALWFLLFGLASTLRWFARGVFFAHHTPAGAIRSDATYSALLSLLLLYEVSVGITLETAARAFAISAISGYLICGASALRRDLSGLFRPRLPAYLRVWRDRSGWSLLGVVTTEATANAHAWVVTLIAGPAAFAPLAASAILMRPVGVIGAALTQSERPRMSRALNAGRFGEAVAMISPFRRSMLAVWAAATGAGVALFLLAPGLIFPADYAREELLIALLAWGLIWLLRALRAPDSALLQAGSRFRPLALASVRSGLVSVLAVLIALQIGGPLLTLAGLLIGEMVFAAGVKRLTKEWERENA